MNLFAVLFHFESTKHHIDICLVFNLLRSVLSQNGIAVAISNHAPHDSLTDALTGI